MGPGPQQPDTKNLILAFAVSMMILLGFQVFYAGPQEEARRVEMARQAEIAKAKAPVAPAPVAGAPATPGAAPAAATAIPEAALTAPVPRAQALGFSPRVPVEAGALKGTIALRGARIDDLQLLRYRETVDAPQAVTLMHPQGSEHGQYAVFGWKDSVTGETGMPGENTLWTAQPGARLTPKTPLVLTATMPNGLAFTRTITIDDNYLFTVTDQVVNSSTAALTIAPYGLINRHRSEADRADPVNHQGSIVFFADRLKRNTYKQIDENKAVKVPERADDAPVRGGWMGFSDRYWQATLIPDQGRLLTAAVTTIPMSDGPAYQVRYDSQPFAMAPGSSVSLTQMVYAGGKSRALLEQYSKDLGVARLDDSLDWGGWLKPLTKPLHSLLLFFYSHIGHVGLAILAITVVIKLVTFPLVYSSYRSFAKLRDVGPKMKEIQTKFAADKSRQQQEMIKLYQTEKINPVAGCIPILLQMPIFFALFKVLSIAIELRHAPFFGWIPDLSSKDPTTVFNLFGLLPFDPTSWPLIGGMLAIGAWPILYGASFWLLQKMQPSQVTDPIQAKVFALMPWLFAIIFAGFSSGLVIYYTWSNLLTIIQQYAIAKSMKSANPIDDFFAKLGKPKTPT